MARLFQIIRGLLYSFGVLCLFIYLSGPELYFYYLIHDYGSRTAAVVTLLFLLLIFVSRAGGLPWRGRDAYPILMREGSYGELGKRRFQPSEDEKKDLERVPGGFEGFVLGITAYRRGNGSLLFVAQQRAKLHDVLGRLIVAIIVTALLSQPLLVLAEMLVMGSDETEDPVGTAATSTTDWLGGAAAWIGGWFSSDDEDTTDTAADSAPTEDTTAADTDTEDTTSDTETENDKTADSTSESETDANTEDTGDAEEGTEDAESSGGVLGWLGEKVGGVGEWFGGLFSSDGESASAGSYLLPSSERELTEDDISGMDADDIQLAINELYAKHGYDFSDSSSQSGQRAEEYFSTQDWYDPDETLSMEEAEAQFSDIERTNLHFLIARRNELR